MSTYEKASETELKIISTNEEIVSLSDLKARLETATANLDAINERYAIDVADYQLQINRLNGLIAEAEKLAIVESIADEISAPPY